MDATVKEIYVLGLYMFDVIEDNINVLAHNNQYDLTDLGADQNARTVALMNTVQTIICGLVDLPNIDTMTLYEKVQIVATTVAALSIEFDVDEAYELILERATIDVIPDGCDHGYYLSSAVCERCDLTESNCIECHPTTGVCSLCRDGFWWDGTHCQACTAGCLECEDDGSTA